MLDAKTIVPDGQRDAEMAKLRAEFMKEIDRYEGYVEQLDRTLLRHFAPSIHGLYSSWSVFY